VRRGSEGQVLVGFTADIESIGLGELRGISVGRAEDHSYARVRGNVHPTQLGLNGGGAEEDPDRAVKTATEQHELRREAKRERLRQMRDYAEAGGCRREMLLQYLGDDFAGPCERCDNCEAASGQPIADPEAGTRREVA